MMVEGEYPIVYSSAFVFGFFSPFIARAFRPWRSPDPVLWILGIPQEH